MIKYRACLRYLQVLCASQKQSVKKIHGSCHRFQVAQKSFRQLQQENYNKKEKQTAYFLMLFPAATFCLGTWQVRRRTWKLNLIEEMDNRTKAPPVTLPDNLDELEDLEYRKVQVRGKFDHQGELYVMPRSPVEDEGISGGARTRTGANIVTAFTLSDSGRRILVNRGWVPRKLIDPKMREEGQITDEIDLVGVLRHTEKKPLFAAKNEIALNHWFTRDIDAMSEHLNTEKIFLDADRESSVKGGPLGGQTRTTLRNEHLNYILTWYSLTAIMSFLMYRRYFLKRV